MRSAALATHCLGRGNRIGPLALKKLWHVVAFARLFRSFVVACSRFSRPVTSDMAEPCTHASDMAVEWCW